MFRCNVQGMLKLHAHSIINQIFQLVTGNYDFKNIQNGHFAEVMSH